MVNIRYFQKSDSNSFPFYLFGKRKGWSRSSSVGWAFRTGRRRRAPAGVCRQPRGVRSSAERTGTSAAHLARARTHLLLTPSAPTPSPTWRVRKHHIYTSSGSSSGLASWGARTRPASENRRRWLCCRFNMLTELQRSQQSHAANIGQIWVSHKRALH